MKRTSIALFALLCSAPGIGAEPRLEEVSFMSHGVALSGTLVLPAGEVHSAVVFIHGSGKQSRDLGLAQRFAQAGTATLVYDKRGVGKSGGDYEGEQNVSGRNISLLADDAVSALETLAAHPRLGGVPTGFAGISQAGWIAPLAAQRTRDARFLLLWSGPVCLVSEEDIYSKYTADQDGKIAPPYELAVKSRQQKYIWPEFLGRDTDSGEDLEKLAIPGLWIFSDNDSSIPVDRSIARLKGLRAHGHRYDYVLFSGPGHNNMDHTFVVAIEWLKKMRG